MNKKKLIVTIIMTLLLTGCSLAKPEKTVSADHRMIGVFITVGEENEILEDDTWSTLGTEELNLDLGTFEVEKKVLIGTYDEKEDTYRFGNHKGFVCMEVRDYTKDYPDFATFSDIDEVFIDKKSDKYDTEVTLKGTLYLPEKLQDKRLRFYNIFQSKDGTIYLDGTLNSLYGSTDDGEFIVNYEYKFTANDEGKIDKVNVHIKIKLFTNSKEIFINQYDSNGKLLERKSIGLPKTDTTISWLDHASFAIVEEVNAKGSKRMMINNNHDEENNESYSYHISDNHDIVKTIEVSFK